MASYTSLKKTISPALAFSCKRSRAGLVDTSSRRFEQNGTMGKRPLNVEAPDGIFMTNGRSNEDLRDSGDWRYWGAAVWLHETSGLEHLECSPFTIVMQLGLWLRINPSPDNENILIPSLASIRGLLCFC